MHQFPFRYISVILLVIGVVGPLWAQKSLLEIYSEAEQLERKDAQKAVELYLLVSNKSRPGDSIFLSSLLRLIRLAQSIEAEKEESIYKLLNQASDNVSNLKANELDQASIFYWTGYYEEIYGGNYDKCIRYFDLAKEIRVRKLGPWHQEVGLCYYALGDIYKYRTYDFFLAERNYEKALQILEKQSDKDDRQLARTYYNLATTNRSQMDFEKALSYAFKTLELVTKINNPVFLERTYLTVANIYRDMESYDKAKEYYKKAIGLNNINNHGNFFNEERAVEFSALAQAYMLEGDMATAISNFEIADRYYSSIAVSDRVLYAYFLQQMGTAYSMVNSPKALKMFARAMEELKRIGLSRGNVLANVFLSVGSYYYSLDQYDSSLSYYQKAIRQTILDSTKIHNLDNPDVTQMSANPVLYQAFIGKANSLKKGKHALSKLDDLSLILDCYTKAEMLLNANRDALDIEKSKWDFLEKSKNDLVDSNFDIYEQIIALLYDVKIDRIKQDTLSTLVLYFMEQSRMKSMHEALKEAERFSSISSGDSLLNKLRDYRSSFSSVHDALNRELAREIPDEKKVGYLRTKIVEVDRLVQTLKSEIEGRYPAFYNSTYSSNHYSINDIKKFCEKEESVFIEYFWGTDDVYALGVSKENVLFLKLGKTDSIALSINRYLEHFTETKSLSTQEIFKKYIENSYKLYELLVQPFSTIALKEKIHIIPDGLISQLPFEALLTKPVSSLNVDYKNLPYLLHRNILSYSFSSIMLLRDFKKINSAASMLAVGYTNGQRYRSKPLPLSEIHSTEPELEALALLFSNGIFLKGSDATEGKFKQHAPESDLLHLAVHGIGDPTKDYSASLFFRPLSDTIEDGQLHSYELYSIRLKAALAVLSACESGLGKAYKGEGMMSMANSFVNAGCSNVALTLWKLNDQVSTKLISIFYQELVTGKRIDESLSLAKKNYLDKSDEYTADPKLWAALVVYSNGETLIETSTPLKYFWLVLIPLFLIVYLLFVRARQR